jgi:hypothetical protein
LSSELVNIAANNTQVAQATGWEDDDEGSGPSIQYLKIKQTKSVDADHIPNGEFFYKGGAESWKYMTGVLLAVKRGRKKQTLYKPGKVPELLCASNDRKTPYTQNPLSNSCLSCAYGEHAWDHYDKSTGEGKPVGACEKKVELLFIHSDSKINGKVLEGSGLPFIFVAQGSKNRPIVEELVTAINKRREIAQVADAKKRGVTAKQGKKPPYYMYAVTFTTELDGENYKIKFLGGIKELTEEQAVPYKAQFEEFIETLKAAQEARAIRANSSAVDQALESGDTQDDEPYTPPAPQQPATRPQVLPPASRRASAGAKPVYQPPVEQETPPVNPADDEDIIVEI